MVINHYDASSAAEAGIATINTSEVAAAEDVLVAGSRGAEARCSAAPAALQFASTMADFTRGNDVFQIPAFGFCGGLTHGGSPTILDRTPASVTNATPGGNFILDNSDRNGGTLYWDATGGSGTDAAPIAVLQGVSALLPTDF